MVNIDLILRLAGIGFVVAIAYEILERVNRKELANLVALGGVAVMLLMVVQVLSQLFQTVLTMFRL
ncbi:MAG: stage III sporulation protein AC [Actinomycetia bacterium]|jgi:stage III sporulation protein AC|nr:stage III sporulation protein AC [Actinomycetes bacterium]